MRRSGSWSHERPPAHHLPRSARQAQDGHALDADREEGARRADRHGHRLRLPERGGSSVERARAIVDAGIPVMGHVGLTPQTATALGGYRSQGRTADKALKVMEDALALQDAGCFSIVFEAVPADFTEVVMPHIE